MIKVYDNFFDEEYFNFISDYSLKLFHDGDTKFFSNHTRWERQLVKDSSVVLLHTPNREFEDEIIKRVVEITGQENKTFTGAAFNFFMEGSYIPWHFDGGYRTATTVFLNREWDPDWQGFFMYREDEEIKAVLPAPNRAVHVNHIKGNISHCTTPVIKSSYLRATLQIFEEWD